MPDHAADGVGAAGDAIVDARDEKEGRRDERMDVGRAKEAKVAMLAGRGTSGADLTAIEPSSDVDARTERKRGAIRGILSTAAFSEMSWT